jgi:hypothetical protein
MIFVVHCYTDILTPPDHHVNEMITILCGLALITLITQPRALLTHWHASWHESILREIFEKPVRYLFVPRAMVKSGTKSSASSATRKKHARKAAATKDGPTDVPNLPKDKKPKGKDKGKNKEPPRKKAYVLPVKPQPVQQDPIDALGLAQRLPPELLVVWRGLSKKDTVTKTKALEELRVGWIDRVHLLSDNNDNQDADVYASLEALTLSLPIWVRSISGFSKYAFDRFFVW